MNEENQNYEFEKYLSLLNPEQKSAVEHEGKSLLILAGAGSGKTRVITTKIAYLIAKKNCDPRSILAVTFTKKAAKEMLERVEAMYPLTDGCQIRTFHSFGAYFLRRYAEEAGIDKNFTVYDDDDMTELEQKALPCLKKKKTTKKTKKSETKSEEVVEEVTEDLEKEDDDDDVTFDDLLKAAEEEDNKKVSER